MHARVARCSYSYICCAIHGREARRRVIVVIVNRCCSLLLLLSWCHLREGVHPRQQDQV